jgi:enoyl-CoA hydratase/carnithine racemase
MRRVPEPVRTEIDGHVARVILNRPQAMNAITVELAVALDAALRDACSRARVVLLSAAGANFCAGGDYRELSALRARDSTRELFDAFGSACDTIAELAIPVVAVVRGCAMAGGFELMQACDFALVAVDARLCDNHANYAMLPAGGGSQRLPRLIGGQRALAHMLLGEEMTGSQAAEMGLAFAAVPEDELDAAAARVAERLASRDATALAGIKRLVREGLELPLAEGIRLEREAAVAHLRRESALEAFGR